MCAMGPEYFEFMKKLEENGDKLFSSPSELPVDFEFDNGTCHVCNGYYGPSFGEPVCVTCHAFLFPDFPSYLPSTYFYSEKTDDGDSGNDEPSDLNYSSERRANRACAAVPSWWYYKSSMDSETSPEDEASRASNSGAGASNSGAGPSNSGAGPSNSGAGPSNLGAGPSNSGAGPSNLGAGPSNSGAGASSSGNGCGAGGNGGAGRSDGHADGPGRAIGPGRADVPGRADGAVRPEGLVRADGPLRIDGPLRPEGPIRVDGSMRLAGFNDPPAFVDASVGTDRPVPDPADGSDPANNDSAGLGPPPHPPCLARSLQALSTPRPPDNLAAGLVEQLPSEVLLCIFSYLDDLSLCASACVCNRWARLVRAHVSQPRWAVFTFRRFPLYYPLLTNMDWHKKYQCLVESCFCRNCLVQMCVLAQPVGEENAWRRNRLRIELKMLRNDPPEGIAASPLDPKCCHWQASVTGPVGSPYEGGIFYLYVQVPYAYPMSPPVVRFLTRILHPNISRHGDVGIDSVHHNWSLALTISKILISIQSLLTDPYTAVCMEPELGEMYVRDRARFEALARNWTWLYAMQDIIIF